MAGKAEGVNAVVALDGSGNYSSINAAIAAAPSASSKPHVVYIKAGLYNEFVEINKSNITLVGEGADKTVISGSRCNADGHETADTAVVRVYASDFIAKGLCIENTSGPRVKDGQAVALLNNSDRSALFHCTLRGFQDTLCALAGKQFYRECRISGTVDFIFGNATAVFQNCELICRLPLPVQKNTITAQARQNAIDNTGFVFQHCSVAADNDLAHAQATIKTFLGQAFSRTVIMQSDISGIVEPEGWVQWERDPIPDTLYYAEYMNTGPGADVSRRVNWPGFRVIHDPAEASAFSVENFIRGKEWLPATGVEFTPGV
ncbi:hypothetical protein HU200_001214 [Digitaria exilis]|uniref:Pectinesterase n=1 Tax=Digitaria exilis TaxID=1010633 RepID=A0A835G1E4_9POAL|nr:hypothetical protein HU200_001214 [Digitaria exilis]CAB3486641.1 unnamed protein product [Digitaria exilis]